MRLLHTRIGSTLFIHDESTTKQVRKHILPDGHAATWIEEGVQEWVVDEVVHDPTKEGSAQFVWDKAGERVKHARVRYTKDTKGNVTRKVEGVVYKVMT